MPKVVAPSVASSAVHRCVASRVRIHPEQAPVYTKWSSPLFFYFSFFSLLFSSLFIFFVSFGSWSSLSEMYMYDTIHEKWKRMAKNTADLRDEIKRGRSLLNNLKSLFIFLFLSFSLFLSLSLSLFLSFSRSFFLPFSLKPFSLSFSLVYRRLFDSFGFSANFPSSRPRETASRQSNPSKCFPNCDLVRRSCWSLPLVIILFTRLPTSFPSVRLLSLLLSTGLSFLYPFFLFLRLRQSTCVPARRRESLE